jgi:hypothetical protein
MHKFIDDKRIEPVFILNVGSKFLMNVATEGWVILNNKILFQVIEPPIY